MMKVSLKSEKGFTLLEMMVAIIIFAVVMIGGLSFFVYGRSDISREGHRRAALELASQRLEELKAADYSKIEPYSCYGVYDYAVYYIHYSDGWYVEDEDPNETVDIDNLTGQSIITTVQYEDVDPGDGIASYDYLIVKVTVSWDEKGVTNNVTLTTLIGSEV